MYSINQITVLQNRTWMVLPSNHVLIIDLLRNYQDGFIDVEHPSLTLPVQINISAIPALYSQPNTTFIDDYLATFATASIPTVSPKRDIVKPKHVKYRSAWDFGFNVEKGFYDPAPGPTIPSGRHPDLVFTSGVTLLNNPQHFENKIVYLVNGRVFFPKFKDGDAYLQGGFNHLALGRKRQVGVLDFSEIGNFEYEVFEQAQCSIHYHGTNRATVKIETVVSMEGKTPLLVVNGHLLLLTDVYSTPDNNTLMVKLNYDRMIALEENRTALELGWVLPADNDNSGYDISTVNPIEYLSQGNSGVILLPTNKLAIHREPLHRTGFFGFYSHYRVAEGIAVLADGTIGHYQYDGYNDKGVGMVISQPIIGNRLIDTVPDELLVGYNNAFLPPRVRKADMVDLYVL